MFPLLISVTNYLLNLLWIRLFGIPTRLSEMAMNAWSGVFYERCITTGDLVEAHLTDPRFGYAQTIPHIPFHPRFVWKRKKSRQYRVEWAIFAQLFEEWDSHQLSAHRRRRVAVQPWHCVLHYLEWFTKIVKQMKLSSKSLFLMSARDGMFHILCCYLL